MSSDDSPTLQANRRYVGSVMLSLIETAGLVLSQIDCRSDPITSSDSRPLSW
jgi:hypothetical protein